MFSSALFRIFKLFTICSIHHKNWTALAFGKTFTLFVKLSGISEKGEIRGEIKRLEKKGGKEDGSPTTMPLMLFSFYRVIQSWRKGRDFFARLEYKQDGIPSCRGCGHREVVFYDHYYRKAKLASIDGRIYDVIIKARRYRCPKCGRIYREPIRGLKSNKRISENARNHRQIPWRGDEQEDIEKVGDIAKHSGAGNPRTLWNKGQGAAKLWMSANHRYRRTYHT